MSAVRPAFTFTNASESGKGKMWSDKDITYLKDNHQKKFYSDIAKELGINFNSVKSKAQRLGLRTGHRNNSRDMRGSNGPGWKGNNASYAAYHYRVGKNRGTPNKCEICGCDDKDIYYDWANLTGNFEDINDYKRMCRSCHKKYDDNKRVRTRFK